MEFFGCFFFSEAIPGNFMPDSSGYSHSMTKFFLTWKKTELGSISAASKLSKFWKWSNSVQKETKDKIAQ